ncbi:hypothetical protein R3P38DRAFT_3038506 [Favolaschia claudopus]|uniref:Uncharacterized protein n=1 Tax=Favolaschia claudopus TaxID=2862362 RepID=A0AAW0A9G1_9AGAR
MNTSGSISTVSGSGSVQSHLSTANSQQRLRAPNNPSTPTKSPSSLTPPPLPHSNSLTHALRLFFTSPDSQILVQFIDHPLPNVTRSWKGLTFKWITLMYCFLSFAFTSACIFQYFYVGYPAANLVATAHLPISAPGPQSSRLSPYILSLGGLPQFEPYVLHPSSPVDGITACLWSTDNDDLNFNDLASWASRWPGPISLVLVTASQPHSTSHRQLLKRLNNIKSRPSLTGVSLHLMHSLDRQYSPSAYLNLARLFANSRTVMLFPANLTNVLPSNAYKMLSLQNRPPVKQPLLLTPSAPSAFSVPDLTPMIIPRHYPVWCSERAISASRASDWDDCVWQLWLEEYGLRHVNVSVAIVPEVLVNNDQAISGWARIRDNLRGRYRMEVCEGVIRRMSTGEGVRMTKSAKRRLQWAKSFCRQIENVFKEK